MTLEQKILWPYIALELCVSTINIRALCLYNKRWARNSQSSESLKKPFCQAIILQWYINSLSSNSMPWPCDIGLVIQTPGCNGLEIKKMNNEKYLNRRIRQWACGAGRTTQKTPSCALRKTINEIKLHRKKLPQYQDRKTKTQLHQSNHHLSLILTTKPLAFFLLVSYTHNQWVLNPQPHPPPRTYKGRRCQLLELIGNPTLRIILLTLIKKHNVLRWKS